MRSLMMTAAGLAALLAAAPVSAQVVVSAQSASTSGAGGTIVASRVPVQIGTGAPSYFDVTINLKAVVSGGVVTGIKVGGTSTPSQDLIVNGFQAGTYVDAAGNTYTVSGPGAGPGGATAWSIVSNVAKSCQLNSATWYTAVDAANPEYKRVMQANINPDGGYSFGVSGGDACNNAANVFYAGALIGVFHTGNGIAISSFSQSGSDYSTPTGTWAMTLQN